MKKKSTLWIAIVMLALVAFFLKLAFTKSDEKDKRGDKGKVEKKVDAIIVKPSLLINEISVSGSLLAFEEVELKNEVAGRVVKMIVNRRRKASPTGCLSLQIYLRAN